MQQNKVACCYLTYNHSETVNHVLGAMCDSYRDHGIDIYIYDSSEDEKTEQVVKEFQEKGFDNIFYVDVRFIKDGNEKYLYVIQGNGLNHNYDYIWPSKDRTFFRGETLDSIVEAAKKDFDVIMVVDEEARWELRWPQIKDEYIDPVEFFAHYGALSTDWQGILRRTDTMSDTVDWESHISTYGLGAGNPFNQTISLFARLAELESPKIRVIHAGPNDSRNSTLSHSAWFKYLIEIWGEQWIAAINSLPEIYNGYKLSVIKSELGLPALFGSTDRLIYLREEGILNQETFSKLKPIWTMITDYPLEYAESILRSEEQKIYEEVVNLFLSSFSEHNYEAGYYLFQSNEWLRQVIVDDVYSDLENCYKIYRHEINEKGYSVLFADVDSMEMLVKRYRGIRDRNK